jgi:hypothetical protein
MVAFSTDFCHFEGTGKDGPAWYDSVLDGYNETTKHHFFEGAMRELFDRFEQPDPRMTTSSSGGCS